MSTEKSRAWLTIRDLEDEFGIEPTTVYNLRHRGDFCVGYRVGNRLRFKRADIEAFIASKADKPRTRVAG